MARKKDELGTREKTIHFRVSEAFYEVIAHEAKQCGLSISEFCRFLFREGFECARFPVDFITNP